MFYLQIRICDIVNQASAARKVQYFNIRQCRSTHPQSTGLNRNVQYSVLFITYLQIFKILAPPTLTPGYGSHSLTITLQWSSLWSGLGLGLGQGNPHTLTHLPTPSHTHTHPHPHPHPHTRPHPHTLTHSPTPSHTRPHPHTLAHTLTHSPTPSHTRPHPHTLAHTLTHSRASDGSVSLLTSCREHKHR